MSQVLCGGWGHGRAQGQDGRPETHCQSNRRYVEYGSCVTQIECVLYCIRFRKPAIMISFLPLSLPPCLRCVFPATVCVSLANLEGEESFDATLLGQAETVVQERVCDDELILVKG